MLGSCGEIQQGRIAARRPVQMLFPQHLLLAAGRDGMGGFAFVPHSSCSLGGVGRRGEKSPQMWLMRM